MHRLYDAHDHCIFIFDVSICTHSFLPIYFHYITAYTYITNTTEIDLVTMVEGDALVLRLGPVEDNNASQQARTRLEQEITDFFQNFLVSVLEHRSHYILLKGRQVLCDFAIDVVVLFP